MPHTLSDLVYYRADLRRIAPLTREEEALLVGQLRLARQGLLPAQLARQARQRLVEGNQSLVVFLARKYHASFRRLDLEDLIQEGNLALVQATERCPYRGETFSGYASLAIREGFAYARCHDWPIYLSREVLAGLYQRGELNDHPLLHACSLDHPVQQGEDQAPLAETIAAPPLLLTSNMDDAAKTRLVEMLLEGLTEQQRQVLRLRFGLDPADQREYPLAEIAERLKLPETNVSQTLKRALAACRRLYAQQGQGSSPRTPYRYQEARDERMAHKRLEQFQKLEEAALALRAQGKPIGAKRLAALAHVDDRVAAEYVRTHRDEAYERVQQQAEQEWLEEASAL
jgi:RNA polymerase sigma factor (sigma-70 family)